MWRTYLECVHSSVSGGNVGHRKGCVGSHQETNHLDGRLNECYGDEDSIIS